jgi:hypothetical protein
MLSGRDSTIVARHEVPGMEFRHLQKFSSGIFGPEGARELSPGFQPRGTEHPERRALKGLQIERTNKAEVGIVAYLSGAL